MESLLKIENKNMEIDELKKIIVRQLLGEATEEENRRLEQWQQQSEDNRGLFRRLASTEFLQKAAGDANRELCNREWKKLKRSTIGKRGRTMRLRWLKVAAAVLLPVLGGMIAWWYVYPHADQKPTEMISRIESGNFRAVLELAGGKQVVLEKDTVLRCEEQGVEFVNHHDTLNLISRTNVDSAGDGYHIIRIPRGGEYVARLEDGSVIHLNAGSELKVPVNFSHGKRNVWLKGEAFFAVAHDEKRLFTVHTDKVNVSVLGTEFDVRAYAEEKEVVTTLVAGSVEVKSGADVNRLRPGDQARVKEMGEIATEKVDVYPFIAWKSGRLVFENERLEKIMDDLQRWYDFELFYANPEVKDMRFTIDIQKYADISKVMFLMEKMGKISFSRQGNSVVIGQK